MKTLPFALLLAGAAAFTGADLRAQIYETFAAESFEYAPGPLGFVTPPDGGFGWADKWYSGLSGYAAMVEAPGLDARGNRAKTVRDNDGSYRKIDTADLGSLVDPNLELGVDGSVVYVSFLSVRDLSSNDDYGGLSLNLWLVAEQLFLGSPSGTTEWGLESPGSPALTVPGSSVLNQTHLVYRIDFQTGDERVRLWLDPAASHPDPAVTAPDLDTTVADLTFNEIRLQSGNSPDLHGWSFDAIDLSAEAWRPVLRITNAVAGSAAVVEVLNVSPNASVIIGYSMTGAGPTNTPLGPAFLSPPIRQLAATANAAGEVQLAFPLPSSLSGRTVYTHAGEISPAPALSNPLVVNIL